MKKLFAVMSILCATYALRASTDYYVMFSVFSPGQIPVAKSSIDGVCLNLLYGEVQNINGLSFGIGGSRVREHMNGLQLNGGNVVGSAMAGAQFGLVNLIESDMVGFQCSLWNDVSVYGDGFQLGVCNTTSDFGGLQLGVVNITDKMAGCQIGLFNWECAASEKTAFSDCFYGLQLGLVNWAHQMRGVQVGLLNFIDDKSPFFFPFVNGRF